MALSPHRNINIKYPVQSILPNARESSFASQTQSLKFS